MSLVLRLQNRLFDFRQPMLMAIVNLSVDSFYTAVHDLAEVERKVHEAVENGADIIDIGACSTRPYAQVPTLEEEWQRLEPALQQIRRASCSVPISIDTFRAEVARRAIEQYGVDMINDISGCADADMATVVGQYDVAYVLTHIVGMPHDMQEHTNYENMMSQMLEFFVYRIAYLREYGVKDIVIDPGFGFAKTKEQNFDILRQLSTFKQLGLPILAGISRKSMLYKTIGATPTEALSATIAANTIALVNGADILRVHDVRQAADTIKIYNATYNKSDDKE